MGCCARDRVIFMISSTCVFEYQVYITLNPLSILGSDTMKFNIVRINPGLENAEHRVVFHLKAAFISYHSPGVGHMV